MEPPPSPLDAGAVCCMCGDRGLPHELLRCKLCRVRLQHRYCSDLYPRATAYRRCNWCLREPAHTPAHAQAMATKLTEKRKTEAATTETSTSSVEEEQKRHGVGCPTTRSKRPAAEIGQPLKKQKMDAPPSPGTTKENNSNKKQKAGEREPLPPSPGAAKRNIGNKTQKADEREALPPSPGAAKRNNGNKKHKADERAELPPSPGSAKGSNGNKKQKADERAELPPSPGAAKGNNGNKKQKADERAALPPSPGATAKGNRMQAGKLTRPGRVKVRRYKLLAEVISC